MYCLGLSLFFLVLTALSAPIHKGQDNLTEVIFSHMGVHVMCVGVRMHACFGRDEGEKM